MPMCNGLPLAPPCPDLDSSLHTNLLNKNSHLHSHSFLPIVSKAGNRRHGACHHLASVCCSRINSHHHLDVVCSHQNNMHTTPPAMHRLIHFPTRALDIARQTRMRIPSLRFREWVAATRRARISWKTWTGTCMIVGDCVWDGGACIQHTIPAITHHTP